MPLNTSPRVGQVDSTRALLASFSCDPACLNESMGAARGQRPAPRPHAPMVRSAVLRTLRPATCWLRVLCIALLILTGGNARAQLLYADSFVYPDGPIVGAPNSPWVNTDVAAPSHPTRFYRLLAQ